MPQMLSMLVASVRENLQDPNKVHWSDMLIAQYLNEAQRILAPLSYSLTYWESTVAAGVGVATRPADLLVPHKVFFRVLDDERELVRRHGAPDVPDSARGYPDTAYFTASQVHLRPVPSRDGTLKISGSVRPTDMISPTDVPSLSDSEPVLVAYATWLCLASHADPTAVLWKTLFEQRRQEWANLEAMRNPQRSRIQREWWW
ncbi:MAG: phage adaptor protein [Armatimonadota bacterium]